MERQARVAGPHRAADCSWYSAAAAGLRDEEQRGVGEFTRSP